MQNLEPAANQGIAPIVEMVGFRLSTTTVLFHTAVADRLGLNVTDLKCYSLIRQAGSMTAGELAEQTGLTTGAITGVIDRLEKAELVQRGRDATDRRRVIVELVPNPAHEEMAQRLYGPMGTGIANLVASYSQDEQRILLEFLTQATEILERATHDLRQGSTR
jgi:DNA-binding MarR family transcriptional regulator